MSTPLDEPNFRKFPLKTISGQFYHYGFLHVKAVFGLVENYRLRPVYDLIGDFLAAIGRQAVHDNSLGIGFLEKLAINLEGLQ